MRLQGHWTQEVTVTWTWCQCHCDCTCPFETARHDVSSYRQGTPGRGHQKCHFETPWGVGAAWHPTRQKRGPHGT
jgi:hypothetical protein